MRLIIISNRLPVTFLNDVSNLNRRRSIGGLVTGIESYIRKIEQGQTTFSDYLWIGWPGDFIDEDKQEVLTDFCLNEYKYVPVFVDRDTMDGHYYGFCNKTLWPLFHYFSNYVSYDADLWQHYRKVNELFHATIKNHIKEGDFVWIHDYHLMLLPALLRRTFPSLTTSFFLHIPFPTHDLFHNLPRTHTRQLLEGLLGADLLGFHTYGYAKNFLHNLNKELNLEVSGNLVDWQARQVKADIFPMGIDYDSIREMALSQTCTAERERLETKFGGRKLLLSIDRLDYTKGIINRLKAFCLLLSNFPEWREKVSLLLIVAPSRREIQSYQQLKQQIDESVGSINGQFGTLNWMPVIYQYRQFDLPELCAIYGVADAALVTPLRDGMNLVAKEYLAAQPDYGGVLILSEMAGAINELTDAIPVNPNNVEELADAMHRALSMNEEAQVTQNRRMHQRIKQYDVLHWAQEIMDATLATKNANATMAVQPVDKAVAETMSRAFYKAKARLLFLDYDGTLAPFSANPADAVPSVELLELIRGLTAEANTRLVIISDKETLGRWFESCEVSIAADLGAWINADGYWRLLNDFNREWKKGLRPLFEKYAARLPLSYVEEKECALVWDYRLSDPELRSLRTREIIADLQEQTVFKEHLDFLCGENSLIIRNVGSNKGDAVRFWLQRFPSDFAMAIGDDDVDEELFAALPADAYTVRVGAVKTRARFFLKDQRQVTSLLEQLCHRLVYQHLD
jgi:trehalose 6-phosphate synthase/phosphatase